MTDNEIIPASPRRATRAARRRRTRRAAGIVLSVVMLAVVAGAGLVVAGVVELPGAGSTIDAAAPTGDPTTTTRPEPGPARRALTTDDPLRLWIAGDSLAGSVGPSLGELTANTGVVQPQYDSRISSGLLNPGFFDWPEHVGDELTDLDPEVVVFVIGTNDANVWDPDQADEYRIRTESMMRALAADGREVYWVAPPVMREDDLEEGIVAVTLIARQAANAVEGVTYVDAHGLFDDEDGEYQQSFENELGEREVMRSGDGVHFSVAGGDYLSRAIFTILDRNWKIAAQADPTQPKSVRETEGSTQVPGTHRSVGATVSNGSATTTTRATTVTSSTTTTVPTTTTTSEPITTTSTTTTTTTSGP